MWAWSVEIILLLHEMLVELPHLPRIKVWQWGLKRDGQHPYVGTIGNVLLLGGLKVEKNFSYACVVYTCVALLAEDRSGELWPGQTSVA